MGRNHMASSADPLHSSDSIVAAYRAPVGSLKRDVAEEAYSKALELVRQETSGHPEAHRFLSGHMSMKDLQSTVKIAQEEYEKKGENRRKVVQWLNGLSLRIRHYGEVLDTLAQHHPEYVALVWGTTKFILMGIIKHAELVEKFATALTQIGDVLPTVELSAELYQTDQMRDTIAVMYSHIMIFFQRAITWYSRSSVGRFAHSLLKPYELSYKDILEKIRLCSETVEQIASAASRAELRDVHVQVQLIHQNYQNLEINLKSQLDYIQKIVTANHAVGHEIQIRVADMHPRIHDIQLAEILGHLSPATDPSDMLNKSKSLARRRQRKPGASANPSTAMINTLNQWASSPSSSLLVLHSGPRANTVSKDLAVSIIENIQESRYKILWSLSHSGLPGTPPSLTAVLKSMVYQAVRDNPQLLLNTPEELSISKFASHHSERELVDLFSLIATRMEKCFVVVECEELFKSFGRDPQWMRDFLGLFQRLTDRVQAAGSSIKVLVVSFGSGLSDVVNESGDSQRIVTTVRRPAPVPPRLRHSAVRQARGRGRIQLRL